MFSRENSPVELFLLIKKSKDCLNFDLREQCPLVTCSNLRGAKLRFFKAEHIFRTLSTLFLQKLKYCIPSYDSQLCQADLKSIQYVLLLGFILLPRAGHTSLGAVYGI